MLITVVGRRSGKHYTLPVGYQRSNGDFLILVSQARQKQWWRNYMEPTDVHLLIKGKAATGLAVVVDRQSGELRAQLESTLHRMPFLARRFGVAYDKRTGLSEQQWLTLSRNTALVRVTGVS